MQGIELPESVAMEILSRLPVKSLKRFGCVCKPWAAWFQTSYFITKHHRNNLDNNNLNLLLRRSDYVRRYSDKITYFSTLSTKGKGLDFIVEENIHFPHLSCHFDVHGPCNGLLLLCLSDGGDKPTLWNPSTREFKTIPESTVRRSPSMKSVRTCFHAVGFGFDSTTNDYKVVRFVMNYFELNGIKGGRSNAIYHVELYSLKSDSWKEISIPKTSPNPPEIYWFNNYVNGICYWFGFIKRYEGKPILSFEGKCILSFDMASEKFSTLPCPPIPTHYFGRLQLVDFNGLLGAIFIPCNDTEKFLELWVMNESNESWTRRFIIETIPGVLKPLGFWKNGEIFIDSVNNEVMLFDPATKEVKNLNITNGLVDYRYRMKLIAYVESLVPINGRSEHEEQIIRQPVGETSNRH